MNNPSKPRSAGSPLTQPVKERLRTLARTASQLPFEWLWSSAFRVAGRRHRPRMVMADEPVRGPDAPAEGVPAPPPAPSGQRILVVSPHPDDEVAGCAAAILAHRRAGDEVTVVHVTDGRRSTAFDLHPDEMARRRHEEAREAARILDYRLEWMGLPEAQWEHDDLTHRLRELLDRIQPGVVYAPSRVDFHFEHDRVARALASALHDEGPPWTVRIYAIQVPLTPVLTNVVVVTRESRTIARALSSYRTQVGSLLSCMRRRRYTARFLSVRGIAEEFWELTPAQYRRLHFGTRRKPLVKTFRGLRYDAWSDPLAYVRGWRERRRLAKQAGSP